MKPLPAALATGAIILAAVAAWSPSGWRPPPWARRCSCPAAPAPRRIYAVTAVGSGVMLFAINPFVSVQGLTVLWQGPHIPILDTQITAEELAYGAGAGMRVAASALAVAAFVRLVDADLLLRAVARLAPRSAMIAALSSRMLPALERDAAGIVVAARTRAARLTRPARPRGCSGRCWRPRSNDRSRSPRRWRPADTADRTGHGPSNAARAGASGPSA